MGRPGKRTTLATLRSSCHSQNGKQRETNTGAVYFLLFYSVKNSGTWDEVTTLQGGSTFLNFSGNILTNMLRDTTLSFKSSQDDNEDYLPFPGSSIKKVLIVLLSCLNSIAMKKMERENVESFSAQNIILEGSCKDLTHWATKWVVSVVIANFACDNAEC